MLNRITIPFAIALATAVLAGQALAATGRGVALNDNFITLSGSTARHGAITFSITNRGTHAHNFNIRRVGSRVVRFRSVDLAPGRHITVTRTLSAGRFKLYCTIHAGMYRYFTVT